MTRRAGRLLLLTGVALLVLLVVGRVGVGFYTDILWHRELGYLPVYWRRLAITFAVRMGAGLIGAAVVFVNLLMVARQLGPVRVRRRYGNLEIAERIPRRYVLGAVVAVALLGGWWLAELQFDREAALAVAAWLRHVGWGITDPVFGRDPAFYVFTLPVVTDVLDLLLLAVVWSLALVALGHVLVGGLSWEENRVIMSRPARLHLAGLVAAMLVLLGIRYWLGRYLLVVDGTGIGGGLGYTDMAARLPAFWILAAAAVAAAASVVYGAWRRSLAVPATGLGVLLAAGLAVGVAWPAAVQKFRVEPNELSREERFIRWNIEFTRRAYDLDGIQRQAFPFRSGALPDPARLDAVRAKLPLWDRAPIRQALNQEQALFQYYRFPDVDYDRYGPPGDESQVAIGVREFYLEGLGESNRTWQSLHLNPQYIRGLGAAVAPAHPLREGGGGPELWVREIRPVITVPDAPDGLRVDHPSVFFGETMSGYAVVVPGRDSAFTGRAGVDYPEGIPLGSFLRVLAFAWRFGDETLLFSGELDDGRLIFRRAVRERVNEVAPFVLWDSDPLPVLMDGRVVWMLDGYTTTPYFPLARAVAVGRTRTRYLRNAVKATIDAVTGAVRLYVLDDADPLLATYRRLFPGLFRPMDEMPPRLRRHLRYPAVAFETRAEILQEYHLDRPEAFYAGQDVWQRPPETTPTGAVREYGPTYALMPVPMREGVEYLATMPFIARARQNMTAVLIARNDPARYGELTLLELPREQQVQGPGQIEAMIEADPIISPDLSLIRQRGSNVDMGHLRVLPLDSTILYVQPIFLSAEANAIPELWGIVVSDGNRVVLGSTLDAALDGLRLPGGARARPRPNVAPPRREGRWPERALELLDRAEDRLREGDWAGYGQMLRQLRTLLERAGVDPAATADPRAIQGGAPGGGS